MYQCVRLLGDLVEGPDLIPRTNLYRKYWWDWDMVHSVNYFLHNHEKMKSDLPNQYEIQRVRVYIHSPSTKLVKLADPRSLLACQSV